MQKSPTLIFVVAAALIDCNGRVLMQRRPAGKAHAGLWEFPGGKVEAAEDLETALERELVEELAVRPAAGSLIPLSFAAERGRPHVVLLYTCRSWEGEIASQEGAEIGWFAAAQLGTLAMPPLDVPLARALTNVMQRRN